MGELQQNTMRGENSNKTPGTYRVFDMGRWKEAKLCLVCQKEFTWRKKWSRCWSEVTTCSERCKAVGEKNHETNNTCITGFIERTTVTRNVMMVIIKLCF